MSGLIHAGANDGREYLLERPERLVLIEPQEAAFARLSQNFAGAEGVTLVKAALGAKAGMARLHLAEPDDSSSLLEPAEHLSLMPEIRFAGREWVAIETLDQVMAEVQGAFDRMVLDVQGYELEVLRGGQKTLRGLDWIKCEVNTGEVFTGCALMDDIDDFLLRAGLRRTQTDLHGGLWGDAIYERD